MQSVLSIHNFPDEILTKVFWYLNPLDLLSLRRTDRRFERLTFDKLILRKVSFKEIQGLTEEDLKQFFVKECAERIIKLDISNGHALPPSCWKRCILKCKSLESLHALDCEFALVALAEICYQLPSLVEFGGSLFQYTRAHFKSVFSKWLFRKEKETPNLQQLQKLHISLPETVSSFTFLNMFLSRCPNIEYLHIHFWKCPFIGDFIEDDRTNFSAHKIELRRLHSILVTEHGFTGVKYCLREVDIQERRFNLMLALTAARNLDTPWQKLCIIPGFSDAVAANLKKKEESIEKIAAASSLFLCGTKEKYVCLPISVILAKSSSVNYLGMKNIVITSEDVEHICRLGRTGQLKYLTLNDVTFEQAIPSSVYLELNCLMNCCQNVVELNLLNTHFDAKDKVCENIRHLKALKELALPSCAVLSEEDNYQPNEDDNHWDLVKKRRIAVQVNKMSSLFPLVKECQDITNLEIHGCSKTNFRCCSTKFETCTEDDLSPLHMLRKLRSLTLVELPLIKQAKFLESISSHCKQFRHLRIHCIGVQAICNYVSSLCFLLENASSLADIRIGHGSLDLNSSRFWSSLAKAKGLRRICLQSNTKDSVNGNVISDVVIKLPNLTVFHIHAPLYNHKKVKSNLTRKIVNEGRNKRSTEIVIQPNTNFLSYFEGFSGHFENVHELCLLSVNVSQPR